VSSRHDPADAVFAALSSPVRRDLVERLTAGGPASASRLAAGMRVSRQAVARHLALLDDAGLVTAERSGREVHYRVTPGPMTDAVRWMTGVGAEWDRRLERLRAVLQQERR
jgi:DNA-binding transcriptional ArsR family regulator